MLIAEAIHIFAVMTSNERVVSTLYSSFMRLIASSWILDLDTEFNQHRSVKKK